MNKLIIFILSSVFLIVIATAELQVGSNSNSDNPKVSLVTPPVSVNYSLVNVNNSQLWQGYTPQSYNISFIAIYSQWFSNQTTPAISWAMKNQSGTFVPYNGSIGNVNLNNKNLSNINLLTVNGTISVRTPVKNQTIIGDVSGNARGLRSMDIQSSRDLPTKVVSGNDSIGIGVNVIVTRDQSFGAGFNIENYGDQSFVIGRDAYLETGTSDSVVISLGGVTYSSNAVNIGGGSTVYNASGISIGNYQSIGGVGAMGLGDSAVTGADGAIAFTQSSATGANCVAMGQAECTAEGSVAIGTAGAYGVYSVAMAGGTAEGYQSLGIGNGGTVGANSNWSFGQGQASVGGITQVYGVSSFGIAGANVYGWNSATLSNSTTYGNFSFTFGTSLTESENEAFGWGWGGVTKFRGNKTETKSFTNLTGSGIVKTDYVMNLPSITLPTCATATGGYLGRNATGFYACNSSSWNKFG